MKLVLNFEDKVIPDLLISEVNTIIKSFHLSSLDRIISSENLVFKSETTSKPIIQDISTKQMKEQI